MFRFGPRYAKRFTYENNKTEVWKLPSGNLFSAINMLLKLEVNVVTDVGSNAPDFQAFNAIERIELIQDSDREVWSMSGQAFALMYRADFATGTLAVGNAAIAGAVANNVAGQEYLRILANPLDAPKPWDFAIDTRAHDYELKIKWRDLTVAGTLFGTLAGTITKTDSENYLEVELEFLTPLPSPVDGKPDSLQGISPLIVGLREEKLQVSASNTQYQIDIPTGKRLRNIVLYTTHVANTLQEVGENDIIQNSIKIYDASQNIYQSILADMARQRTSRRFGLGSSVPAGVYDLNLTAFGSVLDVIATNKVVDLFMDVDAVKQTNNTYIRPIYITQETQGS